MRQIVRDDLSERLIHLTRGTDDGAGNPGKADLEAAASFVSIVREGALRGGTRDIRGGFNCVCFAETPISKLAYFLAAQPASGMRYAPYGVMVRKQWLFAQGGRPVVYQPDSEFSLLHETQQYRHVRYEPEKGIDYTWEREWRICTEKLSLDPEHTTLIVPSRTWERWVHKEIADAAHARIIMGAPFLSDAELMPSWHFIVLEDLGVTVPSEAHPPAIA